jgi:hypothetical protein
MSICECEHDVLRRYANATTSHLPSESAVKALHEFDHLGRWRVDVAVRRPPCARPPQRRSHAEYTDNTTPALACIATSAPHAACAAQERTEAVACVRIVACVDAGTDNAEHPRSRLLATATRETETPSEP